MHRARALLGFLLTVGMVVGSASAAFADSHGHGRGQGRQPGPLSGPAHGQQSPSGPPLSPQALMQQELHFNDLQQASWAAPFVAQLALQGVIQGVGNNSFAPQSDVTRAEAITMVDRVLAPNGAASVAGTALLKQSGYLQFTDDALIPSWAAPYIAYAVSRGLIPNSGALEPNAASTRAWSAALIVRAVEVAGYITSAQAAAYAATNAGFSDESSIPTADVGPVNIAVALGIVSGFPNGTFAPAAPVTRAEFAKMLAVADQLFSAHTNGEQVGTVTGVNTSANSVTIATYAAGPSATVTATTYTLSSTALVFVMPTLGQAQVGSLSQVSTGDQVRYIVDSQGQISWLWDSFKTVTVSGTVVQATGSQITIQTSGGTQTTYAIATGAVITDHNASISPTTLQAGQQVVLGVHAGRVVSIRVGGSQQQETEPPQGPKPPKDQQDQKKQNDQTDQTDQKQGKNKQKDGGNKHDNGGHVQPLSFGFFGRFF